MSLFVLFACPRTPKRPHENQRHGDASPRHDRDRERGAFEVCVHPIGSFSPSLTFFVAAFFFVCVCVFPAVKSVFSLSFSRSLSGSNSKMSAQIGFARSNTLPQDTVVEENVTVSTEDNGNVDLNVLCIEVSPRNLPKMQALFEALASDPSQLSAADPSHRNILLRAQKQLRLMGHTIPLQDANATTVRELKERLLSAELALLKKGGSHHHRSNIAVQLMALRRPLAKRVASATSKAEVERLQTAFSSLPEENAELLVVPEGLPIALLMAQSADAGSPLQFFTLPSAKRPDEKRDLVLFYTSSDTTFGVDCGKLCLCACCAACCVGLCALLCCCCKGSSNDREAQPEGNASNPYNR